MAVRASVDTNAPAVHSSSPKSSSSSSSSPSSVGVSSHDVWNTTKSLTAGGIAGAVSRTVTSPLERLKVMKQVDHAGGGYKGGIISCLSQMARNEGVLSWWKGNGTNVIRIAPSSAIQFFSFDAYKRLLNLKENEKNVAKTLLAGGLAGGTAAFICYPLDLVRSFLSVQTHTKEYGGIADALKRIVKQDGFLGLYRGILPTLAGIGPYIAINFTVFDALRIRYMPSRDHPHYNLINLSCGACAGFVAAGVTYPTDTIRRRMQLQGMANFDLPRYKNSLECIRFTIRDEGINGLYKGMFACWAKVVPSMAIAFMTYEFLRKHWKFTPSSSKPPSSG